jgi:hypothetical protein
MPIRKMNSVGITDKVVMDLQLEVSGLTLTLRAGTFLRNNSYTLVEDQQVTFSEVLTVGYPHVVNGYLVEHKDTHVVSLFIEEVESSSDGNGGVIFGPYYDWGLPGNPYIQLFPASINFSLEPNVTDLSQVEVYYYNYVAPQE